MEKENKTTKCTTSKQLTLLKAVETIEYSQPERKWEISTGRQCDFLAEKLKKGGYEVHLYKSGENFSWD
jgi:hypothetical protein